MTFDAILARLGLMRIDRHLASIEALRKRHECIRLHIRDKQIDRILEYERRDKEAREDFKKRHVARIGHELSDGIKAVHEALKIHFADQMTEVLRAAKVPTKIVEEALARWRRTA